MKSYATVPFAAILAILAAGPLPLVAQVVSSPTAGLQRMKPLARGMWGYFVEHDRRFPPYAITDRQGKPLLSWRVAILPYLGEEELFRQFRLDEPWDSPHNKPLLEKMPEVYAPFDAEAKAKFTTFYQVFVGPGAAFEGIEGITLEQITDRADQTLLIVEADTPVPWTKPEDLVYDPDKPLPKIGGQFSNKFHAVLCDSSCRSLPKSLGEEVLRASITRNGREDVDF
jgi:hypothetical protein